MGFKENKRIFNKRNLKGIMNQNKTIKSIINGSGAEKIEAIKLLQNSLITTIPTLSEIFTATCNYLGVEEDTAKSKRRYAELVEARYLYMLIAHDVTNATYDSISDFVNCDHSMVNYAMSIMHLHTNKIEEIKKQNNFKNEL